MSFWDDFTGASARKDIQKGKAQATGQINAGETAALGSFGTATGRLDPYATGGRSGFDAYLASLGLSGADAQKGIESTYFNDPIQNALMDRITRANTRRFTGVGMGNSGAATQSLTNALLANWGAYQDRLKGVGDTGFGAATTQGGYDTHAGDTQFAAGQHRAGIDIGTANAIAQSRSTGINNLLNVAGTVAKFFNPTPGIPRTA